MQYCLHITVLYKSTTVKNEAKKEKFNKAEHKLFVRVLDKYGHLVLGIWVQALPLHCFLFKKNTCFNLPYKFIQVYKWVLAILYMYMYSCHKNPGIDYM